MTNDMVFWATVVVYTTIISLAVVLNKRLDAIERMLREYFYKIDYHNLDLILKYGKGSDENPPSGGKNNI
ncbi:hypothetical protein SAMN02745784_01827 [Tissierella praeacuta DSM 18095]|uniref:Uncharacterized protein n=1 Tax=Tissierella praeacuta DSM 18095 TaxID=1123404 RepID=A0A1M4WEZ8_9FIRM|nr:hypothetical protein [Tissierella praeacuta]SHE79757.1 hypothetical protein SAMN02745784_01827 [Tissierella praeacuta DSM 18095]SUO99490.1 Uncharacterised protein [Tissierella praeacuta]